MNRPLNVLVADREIPARADRPCGECDACCWSPALMELGKPEFTRCPNQVAAPGHGCTIYADRPTSCRRFNCGYRQGIVFDGIPPLSMRPDKCGVIFYGHRDPDAGMLLVASEAYPGGFDNELGKYITERFAAATLVYQISERGAHRFIGPPSLMKRAAAIVQRRIANVESKNGEAEGSPAAAAPVADPAVHRAVS